MNFSIGSSIQAYSTRSARSNKFFVQRTSYTKTKHSLKVSGAKIWNDLPKNIGDKAMILATKAFQNYLKNTFFYNSNNVLMYNMYGILYNKYKDNFNLIKNI